MPLGFDPVELAMLVNNGFFGVEEEKLEEIAETMHYRGLDLWKAAWECGIDPANLTGEDKEKIRGYLEEM